MQKTKIGRIKKENNSFEHRVQMHFFPTFLASIPLIEYSPRSNPKNIWKSFIFEWPRSKLSCPRSESSSASAFAQIPAKHEDPNSDLHDTSTLRFKGSS